MKLVTFCAALCAALAPAFAYAHPTIPSVLRELGRVHAIDAVEISPDGTHVAWSESVQTRRG